MNFSEVYEAVKPFLEPLIIGAIAFFWQRAVKKRDAKKEAEAFEREKEHKKEVALRDAEIELRAEARKNESLLTLKLMFASNKLAYATAMALKRGKANGEVEEGIEAYKIADKAYKDFLNERAIGSIQ